MPYDPFYRGLNGTRDNGDITSNTDLISPSEISA